MTHTHRTTPARYARRRWTALLAVLAAAVSGLLVALTLGASPAAAEPPAPPSAAEARTMLDGLSEQAEGSMDGYSRDKFPHWSSQGDNCNTREAVLERDGEGVETGDDCYPTQGSWTSPYDGETWTQPSDLDIDHVVPLAEAWRSGASGWTQDKREELANNLEIAQLLAVTDNVNQEKGDKDPAAWMPPSSGYHCTYARMWVWVKDTYGMTADAEEKSALEKVLTGC
ncbi:HNH endonuclease family protein [Streptomyces sp. WMMB303]|uniref:HNH endonuclease family protein n=1 Tax=Streptomyces sp. WMMB303 TaxID=3034154 RepID=UPI0023EB4452|nr:HNH endonuclease family protein [Streptomyces sp. WMMB303]MDF4250429.1 HNH endonuclease family protein [Streptomyces sp. WMMB303]